MIYQMCLTRMAGLKIRYGKYLADLKDQEWASQLTDSIKPVVTDEQGKSLCFTVK
ncbi:hypothetical protein GCM10020331_078490 [Ectobacillus funiculus]